jgi:thiol-disulfide isomerase/thioredoxin
MIKNVTAVLVIIVIVFVSVKFLTTNNNEEEKIAFFQLQDLQGASWSNNDYKGKTLVVNFWATWCPPCIAEMPALNRAADSLKNYNVQFLAFNVGEKKQTIVSFLETNKIKFPILLDVSSSTFRAWGAKGLPTTFFINKNGKIVQRITGEKDWDSPQWLKKIVAIDKPKLSDMIKK